MSFPIRFIPGLKDLKSWILSNFSNKDHSHSDLSETIAAIQNEIKNLNPVNALPDFTRIKVISTPDNSWALNPGTIFKINVPGYILNVSTIGTFGADGGLSGSCDYFYKFASRPEYLYRRTDQATAYGDYDRLAYGSKRCCLCGDVDGTYINHTAYPVLPGISTYMTQCDASSDAKTVLCFVPCKHVSTRINPADYVTAVSRTENHLSTEGLIGDASSLGSEIFAGNWMDNFDSNWSLKETNIIRFDPGFRLVGNFWNSYRFHNLDPKQRENARMFWRNPSGVIVLRYVTLTEMDEIIGRLTDTEKKTKLNSGLTILEQAKLMKNRWCMVYNDWSTRTDYQKISLTYMIATDLGATAIFNGGIDTPNIGVKIPNSDVVIPSSALWYHTHYFYGIHCASVQKINITTGYYIDPVSGEDTEDKYAY